MRKSLWSPDEDEKLRQYVAKHGCGNWSEVARHTGLHRCGKSCRLRWINYLRPDLKRGPFTAHEVRLVVHLHDNLGNSWSKIATYLPGRTDNDVKNFWHSYTRSRRLQQQQQHQQSDNASHTEKDTDNMQSKDESCIDQAGVFNDQQTKSQDGFMQQCAAVHVQDQLQLPAFSFPSNVCRGTSFRDYHVIGSEHEHFSESTPSFSFNNDAIKHYGLPYLSSATDIITHNPDSSNYSSYYPSSTRMPPMQAASIHVITPILDTEKPPLFTMQNRVCVDSNCTDARGPEAHSHKFPQKSTITDLGSCTAPFDHSTPSQEASSSAVPSTSLINIKAANGTDQDWSLMFDPSSMQAYNLIGSPVVAHNWTPVAGIDQLSISMGSITKPFGVPQSVICSSVNQREACITGSSARSADQGRAHDHQFLSYVQNPSSAAAMSKSARRPEAEIQHSVEQLLVLDDQFLHVKDAASFSSTNSYHLLQDQHDTFLDEYTNPQETAICSAS